MKRSVCRACHILSMLRAQRRHISFHTPGHKRAGADITELAYSDNLLSPTGVIAAAERDLAAMTGAERSFLLTDGSTAGIFSMLYALKVRGARAVAVPAYAHRSVWNGCAVLGLRPVVLAQAVRAGIPAQPAPDEVARGAAEADAVLLTSPDYYGFFPALAEAQAACARAGVPLLIDGAHGAHLVGEAQYAGNYAAMWVDGAHKSLPALTQGALVSAAAGWGEWLGRGVRTFRTTSPSYPILASVEYAFRYPKNAAIARAARAARACVGAIDNEDWSKIVVPFGRESDAAERALAARGMYCEFNDGNYLMFYLSPATKRGHLKKLVRLLARLPRGEVAFEPPVAGMGGGKAIALLPQAAVGRTCACDCGLFPPCIPLVRRGEVVTQTAAARLAAAQNTFGLTEGKIAVFEEE